MTMNGQHWCVFDTSLGHFGVTWRDQMVLGTQLDEGGAEATASRLAQRFPGATRAERPDHISNLISRVRRLFEGEVVDLTDIALDWAGITAFRRQVFEHVRLIPPGEVQTYGSVAGAIGAPGTSRAVGAALGRNRFPIIVPCHRVVASKGKLGGFTAKFGTDLKRRMLAAEGAGGLFGGVGGI